MQNITCHDNENSVVFPSMQTIQNDRTMLKVRKKYSGVNYQLKPAYRLKRLFYRLTGKKLRSRRLNKEVELDRLCNASHIVALLPSEATTMLLVKAKTNANQTLHAKDRRIWECLEGLLKERIQPMKRAA